VVHGLCGAQYGLVFLCKHVVRRAADVARCGRLCVCLCVFGEVASVTAVSACSCKLLRQHCACWFCTAGEEHGGTDGEEQVRSGCGRLFVCGVFGGLRRCYRVASICSDYVYVSCGEVANVCCSCNSSVQHLHHHPLVPPTYTLPSALQALPAGVHCAAAWPAQGPAVFVHPPPCATILHCLLTACSLFHCCATLQLL
jgi:hypothetical protein